MRQENSDINSDVASESWFTVEQLAAMRLPGYPRSGRRWHDRAKAEGWKSKTVASQGRTGSQTIYSPPMEILALIHSINEANDLFFGSVKLSSPTVPIPEAPNVDSDDGCVAIDNYVNVRGAAGPGADVLDEAVVKVRVDARLLRERIGSNFGKIKIASVSGDSMEPTLSHGDQVLVDSSCTRFIDDAIYAIQQDGHLRFKRIHLKLDGSIEVRSDASPHVETYSADVASRFYVVGMVIPFKFGRFKV